jgi:response regulator NasT
LEKQVLIIYERATDFSEADFFDSLVEVRSSYDAHLAISYQAINDQNDWSIKSVIDLQADVVLFYLKENSEEHLFTISALAETIDVPIIIIAQNDAPGFATRTIKAGITSYGIDELRADRLHIIIEVGLSRHQIYKSIKQDLDLTKNKLEERKLISKAKGIVMLQNNLSEDEAYTSLRKSAMNQGVTMAELSKKIISVFQMLD